MLPEQLRPLPPPSQHEIFEAHFLSHRFHREVQQREAFAAYCQWYRQTAERHRQELMRMRGDVNLLSWFRRWTL